MRRTLQFFLCFLCFFLCRDALAQSDQVVYDDALSNGWQNWSWCATDLNATTYVHGGLKSARVTYTGAWQGFYLHHTAFDSSSYTDITFWINGGTVNGR